MFTAELVTIGFMEPNNPWKDWINKQYIIWRGESRNSVSDFARYLGIPRQILNGWMNEGANPSNKYLSKVAEKFIDVYSVLGLPLPGLSVKYSEDFLDGIVEVVVQAESEGVDFESPEFSRMIRETFARYGAEVEKTKQ